MTKDSDRRLASAPSRATSGRRGVRRASAATMAAVGALALSFLSCVHRPSSTSGRKPAGKWLLVGDSHSIGPFGDGLREGLFAARLADDSNWHQWAVAGASARDWLGPEIRSRSIEWSSKTPGSPGARAKGAPPEGLKGLEPLATDVAPEIVVIALGTNDVAGVARSPEPDKARKAAMRDAGKLIESVGRRRCFWALPPCFSSARADAKIQAEYSLALASEARRSGCVPIPSAPPKANEPSCATADARDGLHFTRETGRAWGAWVASAIAKELEASP